MGIITFQTIEVAPTYQLFNFLTKGYSDNVLVAVAYYIGYEKEYDGETAYVMLAYLTSASMVASEIVAKMKKRKARQLTSHNCERNRLITNLIPFTNLNIIFAFSFSVNAVIHVIQDKQVGAPNLSIQVVIILACLLITNKNARLQLRKWLRIEQPNSTMGLIQEEQTLRRSQVETMSVIRESIQAENMTNRQVVMTNVIEVEPYEQVTKF